MSRDLVLARVREALGREAGQPVPPPPPPLIAIPEVPHEQRVDQFRAALEKLAGKVHRADSAGQAREQVERILAGRRAIASNAPFLRECGVTGIAGVESGFTDRLAVRERCAHYPVGITSAHFALAETGTLVMASGEEEARLISLLPPVHVAVVPESRLLTGLDELFAAWPQPADRTSAMWFITGPSRTADIEQFLVRGVHGPGEIHVVLVRS